MSVSYLNINSVRNKLDSIKLTILPFVDILCIAESKLDDSFGNEQFFVDTFKSPIRLDVSDKSGGLLLYIRNSLTVKQLNCTTLPGDIQCILTEINLRKRKWLLIFVYRNPKQSIRYFLDSLTTVLDYFSSQFENILILGDFNETIDSPVLSSFMAAHSLTSLIKSPTCFKSNDGKCIDLILTNRSKYLQKSNTFETGISDYHHLVYTLFRSKFVKLPSIEISYRCFKGFSLEAFQQELSTNLNDFCNANFSSFHSILEATLDSHAPIKKRRVRGNQKPHMTKELRKAIMKRSYYKNKYNTCKEFVYLELYKKQRNLIVKMNKKAKQDYFSSCTGGTKDFWKKTKPFFTSKSPLRDKITLLGPNGELSNKDEFIVKRLNEYFISIGSNVCGSTVISSNRDNLSNIDNIDIIIDQYSKHPSIVKIKSLFSNLNFSFPHILPSDVHRVIMNLNSSKAVSGPFSANVIKSVSNVIVNPLTDCINAAISEGVFPSELKKAKITPVFKKGDKTMVENYRPISILPICSKIYERILFTHIEKYFENIFSPLLCGFRSKYSTQHALLRLLGHWQQCLDKGGIVGTVLMDLSKAFDTLSHDLLIAKLHAYGFSKSSLHLLKHYLSERYQCTKIGHVFSEWLLIALGVPQGSILGPLLFNIFINDIVYFIEHTDLCNFADDNTIYRCDDNIASVMTFLQHDLSRILNWFASNQLVANPAKFQMMLLGCSNTDDLYIEVGNCKLQALKSVKLLGISIDSKLNFNEHILALCKKANRGVRCLYRVRKFVNFDQAKLLFNSYISSQFNYAPIIWMFCSKTSYSAILATHKRALRALFVDFESEYTELLAMADTPSIHETHLGFLAIEIFKTCKGLNPEFLQTLFVRKQLGYNLRRGNLLSLPRATTTSFGTSSFIFRGSLLWNSLPNQIKDCTSVHSFKSSIRNLNLSELCGCRICKK